ncbi:MAG: hypothetical protein IMF06_02200, partial [Proteobacteria bacterium]|nr:hypothetical protein [Pseudomonadota bacterium]
MAMKFAAVRFFERLKPLRFGLLLLLPLFLGACSSTTFVYNRLDFILPWYLDDYVDLNREQRASLDASLKPFLHWHRVEELPQYVQILTEIEEGLDQDMTPEMVVHTFSEFEQAWLRLEDEALGWLFELGAGLSEEQIAEFLDVLQEQQEEYEDEYLGRDEVQYRKDSYENFEDGLQDYLGRLDKNQRITLHRATDELMRMDGPWLAERAGWLLKLGALLQREPGWQQKLREQKAAREESYAPEYREAYAHNLKVSQRAIASVISSRSAKQDHRLRKKLSNLKE